MIVRPVFCLALGAAMLSACGSDASPDEAVADADRNAQGDVLGGTISDDMIPLDRLKSKSPPVRPAPAASPTDSTAGTDAPEEQGEAGEADSATETESEDQSDES